jgi:hypothetical protein
MPLVLIFVGVIMMVLAWRDTYSDFVTLVSKDFSGPNNFFSWILALFILSLVGYIPKAKPIAIGLMSLVIIVIIAKRGEQIFNTAGEALSLTQQ